MQRTLFDNAAPAEIVLLDYVATLVANGHERHQYAGRGRPYTDWIRRERYREWLVDLLSATDATVLLVTARSTRYEAATVERMREQLRGWMPREWYFNVHDVAPPVAKRTALESIIFPKYGTPDHTRYLALESNGSTRAMYAAQGVYATPVPYSGPTWNALPLVPAAP
jgi:hypothetical protein